MTKNKIRDLTEWERELVTRLLTRRERATDRVQNLQNLLAAANDEVQSIDFGLVALANAFHGPDNSDVQLEFETMALYRVPTPEAAAAEAKTMFDGPAIHPTQTTTGSDKP